MNESDEELTHHQAFYKGRELEAKGELQKALKFYDLAIERFPSFVKALFQKTKLLYKLGRKDEAKSIAQQIIDIEPKWTKQVSVFLGEKSTPPKTKIRKEEVFEVLRKEGTDFKSARWSSRSQKEKSKTAISLSAEDREILAKSAKTWEDYARQGIIHLLIHNNAEAKLAFQNAYNLNPVNLGVLAFLQLM